MKSESKIRELIAALSRELDDWATDMDNWKTEDERVYAKGMTNRIEEEIKLLKWVLGDLEDWYGWF